MSEAWEKKTRWTKLGKDCLVEVSHHTRPDPDPVVARGPNKWAVYAYVYPSHPHFAAFDGPRFWQAATEDMPLHGGCSFLKRHADESGEIRSIQVGADYSHLHDERHSFTDVDEPEEYMADAERLLAWLAAVPVETTPEVAAEA